MTDAAVHPGSFCSCCTGLTGNGLAVKRDRIAWNTIEGALRVWTPIPRQSNNSFDKSYK
jgi:hypothetical protein